MENNLASFLESFGHTGIYIIDRNTMEVYYENETAQKVTGKNRIGQPCYLVHGNTSMCSSCPLRNENKTSYAIRKDLGMIFMVQALEIKWNGASAYAVLVRKQKDLPKDTSISADMQQRLNRAMHSTTTSYCEINMSTKLCNVINFGSEITQPLEYHYETYLSEYIESLGTSEENVRETLSMENLQKLSSQSDGPKEITVKYHSRKLGSGVHTLESRIFILRDELPHYITILTSDITKVQFRENHHQQLENFINGIPGGAGIYNIYPDGTVEMEYMNDGYYQMIGDTRENRKQYTGRSVIEAVPTLYQEKIQNTVLKAIENKTDFQVRIPNYNAEGTERWLQVDGKIVAHLDGKYVAYVVYTDVTAFENNTQALARANAEIQIAATAGGILYWVYDVEKRQTTITNGKGYGYENVIENVPDSFRGTGDIYPDEEKMFFRMFDLMNEGVDSCDCYARIFNHLTDEYQWQHILFNKFSDKQYIGSSIDVTEQKRAEQQYADEITLRNDLLKDCILFYQVNLTRGVVEEKIASCPELNDNHAPFALDFTCWRNDKGLIPDKETYTALKNNFSIEALLQAWNERKTHISIPSYQMMLSGEIRMIETTATLIKRPVSGDIIAFSYSKDVTDREINKWISTKLLSEQYEGINVIDCRTGRYALYAFAYNQNAMESTRSELYIDGLTKFSKKYVFEDDQKNYESKAAISDIRNALDQNGKYYFSFRMKSEKQEKPVKKMTYFYLDSKHHAILSVLEDVTDVSRREKDNVEKLHAALDKAEQATKAKSEFLSRMSHDMRTPMNGILGMAELSADENDPAVLKANIQSIKNSGDYLLGLINDTLDFQRIESGKLTLEPVIVNATTVIRGILDLVKPAAEKKNINFVFNNINADYSWYVRTDPLRMKQIFINLLSNAIKFTPSGGTITFTSELLERNGMISHDKIVISDTGIGMSEDFINNRLFTPFSQEFNEVTGKYAGSGLGLSIVHSLVELMGGRIEVESVLGKGTTFTVYMNLERVDEAEAKKQILANSERTSGSKNVLSGRHILLAEDHPLNAEIAKRLLKKVNCDITLSKDGQECVSIFENLPSKSFDAILMDVRMPIMDGLEATRRIRQLKKPDAASIPIIAMTANAYAEDVQNCLDAGMNAHISKPIDPKKLYETLIKYIDSTNQEDKNHERN